MYATLAIPNAKHYRGFSQTEVDAMDLSTIAVLLRVGSDFESQAAAIIRERLAAAEAAGA